MNLRSVVSIAIQTLLRHRLRTILTMLGIAIGISAVIATVAIGQAGQRQVEEQLNQLGENLVWIEAGSANVQGVRTGTGNTAKLTYDDMASVLTSVPLIKSASPQVDARVQIVNGNQNWSTTFRGVGPNFLQIRRWTLAAGDNFSDQDVENFATVCLLGQTVADILFPNGNAVGNTIRVSNLPFKVLGVLTPKGYSATGQDQDDFILMPYSTAQHKVKGIMWYDDIMTSAISAEAITPAIDQITALLRERHRIRPGQQDDFNIRRPEEFLKAQEDAKRTFTIMLASIASVSLLVGGIGVMNIMLVSVTERTREIGVRMAVGATEVDVRTQFLAEAVVLSLLGGMLGVAGGYLCAQGLSQALNWPVFVSGQAIVTAVLFSAAIGIFFGYYPARRAAALDPIEALRYE
jgi:putative ABC transport system permease protein